MNNLWWVENKKILWKICLVILSMRYMFHISCTVMLHKKSMAFGSTTHTSVKKWPSFFKGYFAFPLCPFNLGAWFHLAQNCNSNITSYNKICICYVTMLPLEMFCGCGNDLFIQLVFMVSICRTSFLSTNLCGRDFIDILLEYVM